LIGGQACIIYGAAEFSRDCDIVVLATSENLESIEKALDDLNAELIYVPPLELVYLERGHACHFRCLAKEVKGLRIDVISKLRGCVEFNKLWERRDIVSLKDRTEIDVISLQDLVQSKKTQRDKDWFMLKRLVENDIILNRHNPSDDRLRWWFRECRYVDTLIELAQNYPKIARECVADRVILSSAIKGDKQKLNPQLQDEEALERQKDIEYWIPLKEELEILRRKC